jgi:alpha-amylase
MCSSFLQPTRLCNRPHSPRSILTCEQWATGSGGTIEVEYTKGGVPVILIPATLLVGSGMCGFTATAAQGKTNVSSGAPGYLQQTMNFWMILFFILGLIC